MTAAEWQEIEAILAEALALPEKQRAECVARACAGRPAVRAEVEAFLCLREQADAAFGGPPVVAWSDILNESPELISRKLGAYRVVRLLGIGGMGEVYLAERDDDQFHRQVAIKVAGAAIASAEALARFRTEREILASLDHPNIARLLDAGVSENGRPFFVMEYVDGEPLLKFCRKRDLPVADRLALFRSICDAVHFAHQNLIVHRDLKPANILVTSAGVAKLLDFGIAKMLGPAAGISAAITVLNAHPMTPEYASPEQLRGGTINIASDIYSLGALLYELLTGKRPFEVEGLTLEEATRLVTGTEPPKPSRAGGAPRRELEGDLDSIVLKALRSEPSERYGSVEAFSLDVSRYLDGLPVLARRGTFQYVARKFVARHRTAVAGAVIAILLLAAGGALLVHSARVAEAERAKAQQRFDEVRQLANSLLFELHDSVAVLPGATEVRKRLIARAMQYLDRLEKASSGDPALALNLAQSYERLGSVQGHISEMNLGDPKGALASYKRGIDILQTVPGEARSRADILKELAQLHLLSGDVYRDLRDPRARDREYEQVLAIVGPLAARFPNDDTVAVRYSSALFGSGKSRASEDPEAARQLFLRSLAVDEKVLQRHPGEWLYVRNLALDYKYLSSVARSHEEALEYLRKAQALDERRVAAFPQNAQAKLDLSYDFSEMASHLAETGDLSRALELSRRVQQIRNELAAADPRDAQIRLRVVTAGRAVAGVLVKMNQLEAALNEYQAAAARAEAAVDATPADPRNRAVLGELEMGIGSTEGKIAARSSARAAREHESRACRAYARAQQILEGLVRDKIATAEEGRLAKDAARSAEACVQIRKGFARESAVARTR